MPELPTAYFITFSTYGTRLHGDARGSVDRTHNRPGTAAPGYDERRWEAERAQLKGEPLAFSAPQREVVASAIRGVVEHRQWTLHAMNVRSNHVHVAVSSHTEPEPIMESFKRWATRRLRERGLLPSSGEVWARHGSSRWIWNEESLASVIEYVHFGQGGWIEGCGAPKQAGPVTTDRIVGLCSTCDHGRRIKSAHGSTFWLCGTAADDPRLRKYPQLPVLQCHAFARTEG